MQFVKLTKRGRKKKDGMEKKENMVEYMYIIWLNEYTLFFIIRTLFIKTLRLRFGSKLRTISEHCPASLWRFSFFLYAL